MSLRSKTISSVGWTTGAKIAQQAFQFGLSIVLMRLLEPKAFGLIAMVLVFSGFASIFINFGFGEALVQRNELVEEHRSTIFWLNMGVGLLLSLALFSAAGLVARFYGIALLKPMTVWLSLTFILNSPGIVPRALFQRELRFDTLARIDVAALIVSGLVAIGVAAAGGGVWSLVVQQLATAGIASVLLLSVGRWRPRFLFRWQSLRELFGFGVGLTGFSIVNYGARNADSLLIGKFMGSEGLGLYSRAYALMTMPITKVISVLAPVMFPVLSKMKEDKERVRRGFLRVIRLLTFIAFPMMLGVTATARPFVLGVLGVKWAGVIPLIQVLGFVGVLQTLCNPTGWIYMSQGRTDWMFWWGMGACTTLIGSIVIGVVLGSVESVALAYLAGNLIITAPCLAIPGRLINMKLRHVWQAIEGNLACAVAMAGGVWLIGHAMPPTLPPLIQLAIEVAAGVTIYGGLALLARLAVWQEISEIRLHFARRGAISSSGV